MKIRDDFHKKALEIRAIDALLYGERFEAAYLEADNAAKETLKLILKSESLDTLRKWIGQQLQESMEFWSYRKLRDAGQQENVHRWSRMDRYELIGALKELGYK